jgi:hypothetical protein
VPGLIALRNGLLHEMKDVSNATMSLDQSYEFTGNEVVYKDRLADGKGWHGRKTVGKGSITDIITDKDDQHGGSTTVIRRDVEGDEQDTKWRQPRIARTAGSAFIQGNHTNDGREVQTGTKRTQIKEIETETEEAPTTGRN